MRKSVLVGLVALALLGQPLLQGTTGVAAVNASSDSKASPALADALQDFDPRVATPIERLESADIYAAEDGTRIAALYPSKVNWNDAGTWKPIDTRLVPTQDGGFRNASGPVEVRLPGQTGTEPLASITGENWSVDFGLDLAVAGRAGATQGSSVRYSGVLGNVDVEYRVVADGLKETIILKEPLPVGVAARFRSPLTVSGVTPRTDADGSIAFYNPGGDRMAVIPPGIAFDSSAPTPADAASTPVAIRLLGRAGAWVVEVEAPQSWVSDPARVFPLLIDPSIVLGDANVGKDAFDSSANPAGNYNSSSQWEQVPDGSWRYVNRMGYSAYAGNEHYTYLKFDVTPVMYKEIINATQLRLWTFDNQGTGTKFWLKRAQESWQDYSVTRNSAIDHENPGKEVGNATPGTQTSVDMADWVADWASGAWPNHGMVINTSGQNAYFRVGAAEEKFNNGSAGYPTLLVNYNTLPNVPDLPSPEDGWMGASAPALSARYADVDGNSGSVQFEIGGVGSEFIATSNGLTASYTPTLPNGTYSWRTRAWDGETYSAWTPERTFTVDSSLVLSDDWTGTEAGPWSASKWTPDPAYPYPPPAPPCPTDATAHLDICGNQGRMWVTTNNQARVIANMPAISDTEAFMTYRFTDRLSRSRLRIDLRADGTSSLVRGYRLEIQSDGTTVRLKRISGGTATTIDPFTFTYTKDTNTQRVRFCVKGGVVSVKLWADGTPEPATWTRQWTDTSPLPAGVLELQHDWSEGSRAVLLDELRVYNGLANAPTAPGSVNATAGNGEAHVKWAAAQDGGSAIKAYSVTASPGGATVTTTDPASRAATLNGLSNGTSYTFTVKATNGVGTSAPSAPSGSITPAMHLTRLVGPYASHGNTASVTGAINAGWPLLAGHASLTRGMCRTAPHFNGPIATERNIRDAIGQSQVAWLSFWTVTGPCTTSGARIEDPQAWYTQGRTAGIAAAAATAGYPHKSDFQILDMEGGYQPKNGDQVKRFWEGWRDGINTQAGMHPGLYMSQSWWLWKTGGVDVGPQIQGPMWLAVAPVANVSKALNPPKPYILAAHNPDAGSWIYGLSYYYAFYGVTDPKQIEGRTHDHDCTFIRGQQYAHINSFDTVYNTLQWDIPATIGCAP